MSKPAVGSPPSIDTHFHVFSLSAPASASSRYRPSYAATLAQWAQIAGAHGVRRGLVVQPSFFGTDNAELLAALDAAQGALRGVVVIDDTLPADAVAALHAAGVRGLRWNLVGYARDQMPHSARWRPLLETACAHGWHLEVHTDTGRLSDALECIPDVPIPVVVDHLGKPPPQQHDWRATFDAARAALHSHDVYVKLSGPYRNPGVDLAAAALAWHDLLGPHRLLWGSDWPWTNHEAGRAYGELASLPLRWLNDPSAGTMLDANAMRLLGWHDAVTA